MYAIGAALVVDFSIIEKFKSRSWDGVGFFNLWVSVYMIAALFYIAAIAGCIELYRHSGKRACRLWYICYRIDRDNYARLYGHGNFDVFLVYGTFCAGDTLRIFRK